MPYVTAGVLDRDLFNVSKLIEFGYDDASVDATPIIVELEAGAANRDRRRLRFPASSWARRSRASRRRRDRRPRERRRHLGRVDGCPCPARTFSADPPTPTLGGGIEAIHLDGKVEATLDSSVP